MQSFIISPAAYRDLDSIVDYYSDKSPDYADSLLERMTRQFEQLAVLPLRGATRERLAPGLRSVVENPYLIFYRPTDDGVEIVRVLHGSRRITSKMFNGS